MSVKTAIIVVSLETPVLNWVNEGVLSKDEYNINL